MWGVVLGDVGGFGVVEAVFFRRGVVLVLLSVCGGVCMWYFIVRGTVVLVVGCGDGVVFSCDGGGVGVVGSFVVVAAVFPREG